MKPILLYFCFLSPLCLFGQKDSSKVFFDEFTISINKSSAKDDYSKNHLGFGVGVYKSFFEKRNASLILGFEYNVSNQYKSYIYLGHFAHDEDVYFSLRNLSLPLNFRYNMEGDAKFFMQVGTYIDFIVGSKSRGMMYTYLPDENNNVVYNNSAFNGDAGFKKNNVGLSLGLGLRIPIKKIETVLKFDYKLGFFNLSQSDDYIYNSYARFSLGIKI